ncbi:MAG: HNH endonuclease [bacterium]|nr:HNH endonuclease [bacterium]
MSSTYIPQELRRRVARQSRYRCGYCLSSEKIVGMTMTIDHLIPESLGGPTEEENLWLACSACNGRKGSRISARDPQTGEVAPFFNPREQSWDQHFEWSDTDTHILGKTPTGRVTVNALHLNRKSLVEGRRSWVKVGWHPPSD